MVEFQFFDGCPNATKTLNNLNSLVDEGFLKRGEIKVLEIKDQEDAKKMNFQGSPTILVDGIDIYSEKKPASYAYSCRLYLIDDIQTGIIPTAYIRSKVAKLKKSK